MACCAAAIFVIVNILYGVKRALVFLFGRRLFDKEQVWRPSPSVIWQFGTDMADVSVVHRRPNFTAARAMAGQRPAFAAIVMLAVSLTGFWFLTKPGVPSPLPEISFMHGLHAAVCGPGVDAATAEGAVREDRKSVV